MVDRRAAGTDTTELRWLNPNDDLRDELGLDSLDFLAVVTRVSGPTGRRIEEDDYDQLTALDGWVRLLSAPAVAAAEHPRPRK